MCLWQINCGELFIALHYSTCVYVLNSDATSLRKKEVSEFFFAIFSVIAILI